MAFNEKASIMGDTDQYMMSPTVKKYTLMDTGFVVTKGGNFQLERSLDANSPYNQAYRLKITISQDMRTLKMSAITGNGLKAIDIFKSADMKDNVEQFHFILANLIERDVLKKV